MVNISCIILNYNDSATTIRLAEEIKGFSCLGSIVVVDNCSSGDEWKKLQVLKTYGGRIRLLRTRYNGGYGKGNQAGIIYAMKEFQPDYIIIANPDIHVTEACILRVLEALERQEDGAAASAMVDAPDGRRLFSYWDLLPLWKELLDTGLIARRVFKKILKTPLEKLPPAADGTSRLVGALPGSFFMLKMSCFTRKESRNLFDRNLFLYCEEKVLGKKLAARGWTEVLVTDASYVHAHSVSIDRNVSGIAAKQAILHKSKLYYYRRYLHAGPAAMACARVYLAAVLLEVRFLTEVLKMRW